MRISARPATADDAAVVASLLAEARTALAGERGGGVLLANEFPVVGDHGAGLEAYLAARDGLAVVGTIDDVPLGLAMARLRSDLAGAVLARLEVLHVAEGARQVGLGEAIAACVLEWASRSGASGVDALALPGMRQLKNFYESSGYVARLIVMHRPVAPGDTAP